MKRTLFSMSCALLALNSPIRSNAQLLWTVGFDDNDWPIGNGGGPNASFVQENGSINPLPGIPNSPEVDRQADNDYYFAGVYNTVNPSINSYYGDYAPVGEVGFNEEAAERAFAGADNDLRYHFNLPSDLSWNDRLSVSFDALFLDTFGQPDPRYGVEVYFNGVLVQTQIVIRPAQLHQTITTPPFTLSSVDAQVGAGYDNIVSLRGINYNSDGGGNWMGIDYVQLNHHTDPLPLPVLPWSVGRDDNDWPVGNGGGPNASFVQENGTINALPGSANSPEVDLQGDNDYYFAGAYTNVLPGNGSYTPVGIVRTNEESAERAFAAADNALRYHFNLPASLSPADLLSVTFDALNLHIDPATIPDPRHGIEVYFNGVLVQPQIIIRPPQLDVKFTTQSFTLASVNAQPGPGFDNIVTLRGVNYNAEGGGNWMGIDHVQLNHVQPKFLPPSPSNGKLTLDWIGAGQLEWSPTVLGPWTPFTPAPTPPYTDYVVPGQNRFYRLKQN